MTRWQWLGVVSCLALAMFLEWRRRHRAYWEGPYLRNQLLEWYEQDAYGDEPTIRPLKLPAVKPLKGELTEQPAIVARFGKRLVSKRFGR